MGDCWECGGELVSEIKGSSLVVTCSKCGMSIARSWSEPIREDPTDYKIILTDSDCSPAKLKAIAKITGFNYLTIRKISQNTPQELCQGWATVIRDKKKYLDDADVKYIIEPKWKY